MQSVEPPQLSNSEPISERPQNSGRLSIWQFMVVTAGVALAFSFQRGILNIRSVPDSYYYGPAGTTGVDLAAGLVAMVDGLSVAIFVLALRSKPFWAGPGKTLAMLFLCSGNPDLVHCGRHEINSLAACFCYAGLCTGPCTLKKD